MKRESLEDAIVVVTSSDGEEVEVDLTAGVSGNYDQKTKECLLIGCAVRDALMLVDDGDVVAQ